MTPELRAYHPSARERTEQLLRDLFSGGTRPSAVQASQIRGIMNVLDFTPVVGNAFALDDAGRMLDAGIANRNPWQVAGGLGLGAAALLPLPLVRKALRARIARAVHGIDPPQMAMRPIAGYPERTPVNVRLTEDIGEDPITRASSDINVFDPPEVAPRPFELDYPRYPETVPTHKNGRLLEDIDGRKIESRWIVGRNRLGGPDRPFPRTHLDALAKTLTGRRAKNFSASELGDNVYGRVRLGTIDLLRDLAVDDWFRVYRHEIGHVMDTVVGKISTEHLDDELRIVFNDQRNPSRFFNEGLGRPVRAVTPEDFGYTPEQASREYVAEAIRAILSNPNYVKTVAPKTTAVIREAVYNNAALRKIIHINSAMALPAGAIALAPPDDESAPNTDARKEPAARARTDPSDPRASDRLSIGEWMKLRTKRNEIEGKEPAERARINSSESRASDGLSIEEWMELRREQLRQPKR